MVLRQGLELTVAGIVLGLLGAVALTRVMASLLFGVSTTDVVTFAVVPVDPDRDARCSRATSRRCARRASIRSSRLRDE